MPGRLSRETIPGGRESYIKALEALSGMFWHCEVFKDSWSINEQGEKTTLLAKGQIIKILLCPSAELGYYQVGDGKVMKVFCLANDITKFAF